MIMENNFKGILQYTKEQFDKLSQKEKGYIYLVRKDSGATNGDAEIWFGNRRYGNIAAIIKGDAVNSAVLLDSGSEALGNYASAIGNNVIAAHEAEFACGKYNVSDSNTLFSIGNGTSDTDRKNALEITNDGSVYIGNAIKSGKIFCGTF